MSRSPCRNCGAETRRYPCESCGWSGGLSAPPPAATTVSGRIDEIIAEIEAITDPKECHRIYMAVQARAEQIHAALQQRAVTERWKRLEKCRRDTTLYCTSHGVFLGGVIQRGDSVKVVRVDKDREIIHVRLHRVRGKLIKGDDQQFALTPRDCSRYALDRDPPEKPVSASERRMADALGEVMGTLNDTDEAKTAGSRR